MRKIINVITAICLTLSLLPVMVFAVEDIPFQDISQSKWYYPGVAYVWSHGMMSGTSDKAFSPDVTTSRGMIVTILHSLEGKPASSETSFRDVKSDRYYAKAVSWASQNGIVAGYGQGRFGPNDNVTREQLVSILYKYVQYKGITIGGLGNLEEFKDLARISSYAVEPMKWAVGNELLSGMPGKLIEPKSFASRAQIATIMMKLNENVLTNRGDKSDDGKDDHSDTDNKDSNDSGKTSDKDNNGEGKNDTPNDSGTSDTFEVVFKDNDGNILKKETVLKNKNATPPEPPNRAGFVFDGWSGNYQNVVKNETVVATYKEHSGENTFIIDSANMKKGETATIYLKLTGKVKLVDFDMELAYDRDVLEVVGLDYKNGIADIANDTNGTILLNFSAAQNITTEDTVLAIQVKVKDTTKESKTEIAFKEVKFVDYLGDNNMILPAPYSVVPGVISIQ